MADIKEISSEVASEIEKRLNDFPPYKNELINADGIKKAIVTISTEICCKVLEKYEQQKS